MKHLPFLQPPKGWGDGEERKKNRQWTEQDMIDRVNLQKEARSQGKSCVFNVILLASATINEEEDRCIGGVGFATIDGDTGYLGITLDRSVTRKRYATEALYTSIVFAFEKLGIGKIVIQTDNNNEEMRGWCEKTAELKLIEKKEVQINQYHVTQCQYEFTDQEWENIVRKKLETKLNGMFMRDQSH
ncbi:unnamed protein product [Rotaria sp. Silwood2]|nr:unnamed protein product [Rotaria sp. Silwood2]